jgi:hypothetical protein
MEGIGWGIGDRRDRCRMKSGGKDKRRDMANDHIYRI